MKEVMKEGEKKLEKRTKVERNKFEERMKKKKKEERKEGRRERREEEEAVKTSRCAALKNEID
ncbi:hypothetical protein E2C01_027744 [Portunus trituberculatus]|uniref:Uncharacterized protein n=1 Tax=Portunus trituberculatus TaxID=210409 RepID=A0A5B7EMG5_PORTR|nr:hypothetical protein [Portunus trituberculatus]